MYVYLFQYNNGEQFGEREQNMNRFGANQMPQSPFILPTEWRYTEHDIINKNIVQICYELNFCSYKKQAVRIK